MHRDSGIDDREEPAAHARGLPHDSLAEFLDCDYRRLVAGLALLSGCRASAEDAVQEALAWAWQRGLRGEQINSLRAFVAVVATNLNLLRSRFRRLLVEQRARQRLGEGMQRTQTNRRRTSPLPTCGSTLPAPCGGCRAANETPWCCTTSPT